MKLKRVVRIVTILEIYIKVLGILRKDINDRWMPFKTKVMIKVANLHDILYSWKNWFDSLLNVNEIDFDLCQRMSMPAEPFAPEPSISEVEHLIDILSYKNSGVHSLFLELIKYDGITFNRQITFC